jgi:hypothetical protein
LGISLITRDHAPLVTTVAPQISWTLGMKYSHHHGFEPKVYKSMVKFFKTLGKKGSQKMVQFFTKMKESRFKII